jgi:hypothetical protein
MAAESPQRLSEWTKIKILFLNYNIEEPTHWARTSSPTQPAAEVLLVVITKSPSGHSFFK